MRRVTCLLAVTLISLLSMKGISYAVKAAPREHILSQPDGTTFKARQWGDERMHGWETVDGHTIVKDEATGYWYYATVDNKGELQGAPDKRVGDFSPSPDAPKRIRPQKSGLPSFQTTRLGKVTTPTGTANIPVILINFNDTSTTYSASDFNTLLFGDTGSSMKDYFEEVSYGKFTVSAGPSGIVGWYTASKDHDYYGAASSSGVDSYPATLVIEAVKASDSTVDFSEYDQDGDCYVDVVSIIHQGTGEEASGDKTDIWSHSWNLNSAAYYGDGGGEVTTNDICNAKPMQYVKVNDYIIQPELYSSGVQSTIGVFAHEYGHALGLPDLYDTDGTSEGIGNWSLMAGGAWNYTSTAGDSPAHLDAWSKYYLGWVTPTEVTEGTTLTDEPITAASQAADVYLLRPPNSETYFLVENRQKSGFDAGLPGEGLLIWYIDEDKSYNTAECYPGGTSCAIDHYRVKLIQADNLWELEKNIDGGDAGDPFPGSHGKTSLTHSTSPASDLHNQTTSGVSITDISAPQTVMTATLSVSSVSSGGSGVSIDNGGCFIATAAYGSYVHPYVVRLSEFRDRYLMSNPLGRVIVRLYYRYSPPIADFIRDRDLLKGIVRILLTPVVMFVIHPFVFMIVSLIITVSGVWRLHRIRRRSIYINQEEQ